MELKYTDGKYHIEEENGKFFIKNVFGEKCQDSYGDIFFTMKSAADLWCGKINLRE